MEMARIQSELEEGLTSEDRIESRLISDARGKATQELDDLQLNKSHYRAEEETRAMDQLAKVSDYTLQQEQ